MNSKDIEWYEDDIKEGSMTFYNLVTEVHVNSGTTTGANK